MTDNGWWLLIGGDGSELPWLLMILVVITIKIHYPLVNIAKNGDL